MNASRIQTRLRRLTSAPERGAVQVFIIFTVVVLVVVVGLVVDGAGKVSAANNAQHVAASAARAATNAIGAETIAGRALEVDELLAEQVALDYIATAGMTGTATAEGSTITVTTQYVYATRFVSLIGIQSLIVNGEAEASLIDGPTV